MSNSPNKLEQKLSIKPGSTIDMLTIMKFGLDHGLVDTKVASINDQWSALKFVFRLTDR